MAKSNTWLRKAGKWLKGVANGISSLWNKSTGSDLTNAERQTMEWNAQQAQENRTFQSAEAEKARQWQEDYYNQYESPQARIRQYEEAGLNPALLYGSQLGSGSAPSTSVPSGDSASVGLPSSGAGDLLSFIGQMFSMKSIINKNNADALNAEADAANKRADTKLKEQEYEWNPELFRSEISKNEANAANLLAGVKVAEEQVNKLVADQKLIASNIDLNEHEAHLIIQQCHKTAIEAANESLRSQGIKSNNRLLAQQLYTEIAKTALTEAEVYLTNAKTNEANANTALVSKKAISESVEAAVREKYGVSLNADGWALAGRCVRGVSDAIDDLWNWITGTEGSTPDDSDE